jgi:hypothetical protein
MCTPVSAHSAVRAHTVQRVHTHTVVFTSHIGAMPVTCSEWGESDREHVNVQSANDLVRANLVIALWSSDLDWLVSQSSDCILIQ